jgi:vancomycin resistance protein YoaR
MALPRNIRLAVTVCVFLVLLSGVSLALLRVTRSGALPGTLVAGVDVGGLEEQALRERIGEMAATRGADRIVMVRPATSTQGEASVTATKADLGYRLDVDETVDTVLERGRQGNPLAALGDHLAAFVSDESVEPVELVDNDELTARVETLAADVVAAPQEGDLVFKGRAITRVEPAPGAQVDFSRLLGPMRRVLLEPGAGRVELPTEPVAPVTDEDDVTAVLQMARRATSGPVQLVHAGEGVALAAADLAKTLDARVSEEDGGSLELVVQPKALEKVVGDSLAGLETEPVDASFELVAGEVRIVRAQPGFVFSAKKSAPEILEAATSLSNREAKLRGDGEAASFTTADARALDIDEQVSTFTTYHSCCEPRVTNIHRIAEIVDGAIVAPGEIFSLNGYAGPRTAERGFVEAPAILNGEYVEQVGGGVSQFATTLFNAIFFGGYDFTEYKAHSYYIDRYPMGREATVSDPAPDLEFVNDSDAGIYIDTSYTETSITVTFYGNTDVEVDAIMGEPYNYEKYETQVEIKKGLAPGARQVTQTGSNGFDVVVKRVMRYDGGETEVEEFFTRYLPVPEIVERGPKR